MSDRLAALALVFYFGRRNGGFSIFRLLLSGLGVGLFLSSLVAIFMLMAGEELKALIFFFLGGFSSSSWDTTWVSLACIPVAVLVACYFAPEFNVLLLGEETAQSSGVRTGRIQLLYAILAALLTSISVSVAGLIGFVGLIVPHMIRLSVWCRSSNSFSADIFFRRDFSRSLRRRGAHDHRASRTARRHRDIIGRRAGFSLHDP